VLREKNVVLAIRRYLMRVYDSIALSYHGKRVKPWKPIVYRALLHLKPSLRTIIADIGCGSGHNTIEVAIRGFYVIGLDISLSMILLARKRFKRRSVIVYSDFIQADMLYLPFRNNSIHSLIYIASLHHIPSELCTCILRESYRCLRVPGLLVITVWSLLQLRHLPLILWSIIGRFTNRYIYRGLGDVYVPWRYKGKTYYRYYHLYLPSELKHLISKFNFKIVEYGRFDIRRSILPQNYFTLAIKVK